MELDPLLRVLVDDGWLTEPQAATVAGHAEHERLGIDAALLSLGLVDEPTLLRLFPRAWGGEVADRLRLASATTAARAALPRPVAEEHRLVPLELNGRKLTVACCVPEDRSAFEMTIDEVGFSVNLYLRTLWTTEPLNARELHRAYGTPIPQRLRPLVDSLDAGEETSRTGVPRSRSPATPQPPDVSGWSVTARIEPAAPTEAAAPTEPSAPGAVIPSQPPRRVAVPPLTSTMHAASERHSTSTPPTTALHSATAQSPADDFANLSVVPGSIAEAIAAFTASLEDEGSRQP